MVTDKIADIVERNDLFHFGSGKGEGQGRTGINQNRLIPMFNQVAVALEQVIIKVVPDPPDALGYLDSVGGVNDLLIVGHSSNVLFWVPEINVEELNRRILW